MGDVEISSTVSGLSYNKEQAYCLVGSLDFDKIFLICVYYSKSFTKCLNLVQALSGAQNERRLCNMTSLLCKLLCYLTDDPADPVVLEVLVAHRKAVWKLCQVPIG